MTHKEMENRIKNLELAISALASKTYNRETRVEESVGRVETKAENINNEVNVVKEDVANTESFLLDLEYQTTYIAIMSDIEIPSEE